MRVILAGGGTGGHLFAGLALTEDLPLSNVHFLCTPREFDLRELSARSLPFTPVKRGEVRAAWRALRSFQADVVVALGGGGALAALGAAALRGVPAVCLEQNVLPGRLNRFAARFVRRFYAQWMESKRFLPGLNGQFLWSGSPLRKMAVRDRKESRVRYGLDPERTTLLVVGGSQGAEALNRLVPEASTGLGERGQFLHLAGSSERVKEVVEAYRVRGVRAAVVGFECEMEWAYSAADACVSRAGALTLAELCRFRIPALLVPYPHATDDHQAVNARAIACRGAASWVAQGRFSRAVLQRWWNALVSSPEVFDNQRSVLGTLDRPDAGRVILRDLQSHVLR